MRNPCGKKKSPAALRPWILAKQKPSHGRTFNPRFPLLSSMGTKKVEFHEEAVGEFLAAVEWYLARNELVASRFAQQVTHAVQ